ncbi:beta-1,6-N-acetylglucosaminyltransferase [Chitinophaga sp. Hz27]|uniref:beta-1,6-N-acetylglucosaminyltransferase n=1 Tax=Chitinophaga sp. Hz27 TaxID=3347169 RepID=UPI0035D62FD4
MRIAFIILAHKNPEQLLQLLRRLSHPRVDCYVHLDARADTLAFTEAAQLPQVYFIPGRIKVHWAGFSMVKATLNSLDVVLGSRRKYLNISLLSGLDYPLRPIHEIVDFFTIHQGNEFLDIMPEKEVAATISKLDRYHFEDIQFKGKYFLTRWINRIMPSRKCPMNFTFTGGSQWWSLSEDCLRFCKEFLEEQPSFIKYFRYTWGSDEFIFHTIIMNNPEWSKKVVRDNLRYIDWSARQASPKVLGPGDLPNMIASGKFFARKFDTNIHPNILNKVDALLEDAIR